MAKREFSPGVCYGYARASTEDQEVTIQVQQDAIRDMYKARYASLGYRWGKMFSDEGSSGSVPIVNRVQGHQLMMALEPGDMVLMHKLDRGWRNVLDFSKSLDDWTRRGIRLAFVTQEIDTGGTQGKMHAQMLAMYAEYERNTMSDRMKLFNAKRKKMGLPYSGFAPHGFKIVGPKGARRFQPFPELRAFAQMLVAWREQGCTLHAIRDQLARQDIVHPGTGRLPSVGTIWLMIGREISLQKREAKEREGEAVSS